MRSFSERIEVLGIPPPVTRSWRHPTTLIKMHHIAPHEALRKGSRRFLQHLGYFQCPCGFAALIQDSERSRSSASKRLRVWVFMDSKTTQQDDGVRPVSSQRPAPPPIKRAVSGSKGRDGAGLGGSKPTGYCYTLAAIACLNSCNLGYDIGCIGGAAMLMQVRGGPL